MKPRRATSISAGQKVEGTYRFFMSPLGGPQQALELRRKHRLLDFLPIDGDVV
jgi:hypothetical protein